MIKNQPKSIFLQLGPDIEPDEDFNNLSIQEMSWHKTRIFDTDLDYISVDAAIQEKCDGELITWFLVNLLRRPEIVEDKPAFDKEFINA